MFALALVLAPEIHAAGIVSLTNTNNIGILGLIGATISNTGTTAGNAVATEGIASSSTLTIGGSGTTKVLTGTVYEGTSGEVSNSGPCKHASGGCTVDASDLASGSALLTDAANDATTAGGLAANQTLGAITTAKTITACDVNSTGCSGPIDHTTVASVSSVTLTSANLTLSGNASDYFILQISGTITLNSSANIQLSGGLLASHVLYVFTGTSTSTVASAAGDTINGTLLATGTQYTMALKGTLNGMIVDGGTITVNGLTVNSVGNEWDGLPEPGTWAMLAAGLAGIAGIHRWRRERSEIGHTATGNTVAGLKADSFSPPSFSPANCSILPVLYQWRLFYDARNRADHRGRAGRDLDCSRDYEA